ncbi:uncharacterized protein LOC120357153 [Solenopsis invicta]|uniref:uncharacterized protein LOC120357152 n=1 Tax=Solenopsis invicta TaxID=13686 RepID=UPI00193CA642|nr:uncharacterized protein LOC120357152 [Solenopsis invicta]XP_039302907.1 uncharacterized protein LOC120357152 [Solenopsis invicta]XP_039302908.1 uncharacterized protein LOC120357153 [Solenopsis invicta]XP_039302909.1 uncharacterized protein LOC120357153 [Solenopsis invicta]
MFISIEQFLENNNEWSKARTIQKILKEAESEKVPTSTAHSRKKKCQEQASNNIAENNKNQPNSSDLNKNNENELPEADVNMMNATIIPSDVDEDHNRISDDDSIRNA